MNKIINRLRSEGWYINEVKLENVLKDTDLGLTYDDIKNYLLNMDIKYYGESWINCSNKSEFECHGIFQINKIKNVAAPEVDQTGKHGTPLLKFTITDGVTTTFLLDLESNAKLNFNIQPGCKLTFNGKALFKSGMVILVNKVTINFLGGKVLELIEAENVQKSTRNRVHVSSSSNKPPKFIPFGKKLNINVQEIRKFKAMQTEQTKENSEVENSAFGDKREAVLAEIRKSKEDSTNIVNDKNTLLNKFHGGGTSKFVKESTEKQDQQDSNVAYLMSNGFKFNEVQKILKENNNDVNAALDQLLQKRMSSCLDMSDKEFRGRGRRGRGKPRANSDEDDFWFDPAQYAAKVGLASRPNTTISLSELMGNKSSNTEQQQQQKRPDSHSHSNLIRKGYQCLAEVMDGSYQPSVVVDILPNKCLKVQYLNSGEMIETNVTSLKTVTGEKVFEHMVPNVQEKPQLDQSEYYHSSRDYRNNCDNNYGGRGRGSGHSNRRRGGRFHRRY